MKSKLFPLLAAVIIFSPVIAKAGEIRGILKLDERAVPNAMIEIQTSNHTYSTKTDVHGSYRLLVSDRGECKVTVVIEPQHRSSSATVNSFDRSVEYNLVLKKTGEAYTLLIN